MSPTLYQHILNTLSDCGGFISHATIKNIFFHPSLNQWQKDVPETDTEMKRIEAVIAFASRRRDELGENGLALLLQVLANRHDPTDSCYGQLMQAANALVTEIGNTGEGWYDSLPAVQADFTLSPIAQNLGTVTNNVMAQSVMLNGVSPDLMMQMMAQLAQQAVAQAKLPSVHDLFQVVGENRAMGGVPVATFYPQTTRNVKLHAHDPRIPYQAERVQVGDTQTWLQEQLGELLVLVGGRGVGKTREIAELAQRYFGEDWVVCVAQLGNRRKMGAADGWLDSDKLLFVIDDLHKHAVQIEPHQASYWDRLYDFLQPYWQTPTVRVRVLVTTLPSIGHAHLPPPNHPLRQRLNVCELPAFSLETLTQLLADVAENAGIQLPTEPIVNLVKNSNRTPKTIIANLDRALRSGGTLTVQGWEQTWEGRWDEGFRQTYLQNKDVVAIFQALHLLLVMEMPARWQYVSQLAQLFTAGDTRTALNLLLSDGQLGQNDGVVHLFNDGQIEACLARVGGEMPALTPHLPTLIQTILHQSETEPTWLSDLLTLSEWLFDFDHWTELINVASVALHRNLNHASLYMWRALAYFNQKNLTDCLGDLNTYLTLLPNNIKAQNLRGSIYLLLGEFENAEADLSAVIAHGEPIAYQGRGLTRLLQRNITGAIEDFTQLLDIMPESGIAIYGLRGYAHFMINEFEPAISDFTNAIQLKPNDTVNYFLRANAYLLTQNYADLDKDLTHLLDHHPFAYYAWLRGLARSHLGQLAKAEADYSFAIANYKTDPFNAWFAQFATATAAKTQNVSPELLVQTVSLFQTEDGLSEEVADLPMMSSWMEMAMDKVRHDTTPEGLKEWKNPVAVYHFMRGQIRVRQNDLENGLADFQQALQLGFNPSDCYWELSKTNYQLEDLPQAEHFADKFVQINPDSTMAYHWRGAVRLDAEKYEEALADLAQFFALGGAAVDYHRLGGRALIKLGRLEEAEKFLTAAVALKPDLGEAYFLLAAVQLDLGNPAEAVAMYDQAEATGVDLTELYFRRGTAHMQLDHAKAAAADLAIAKSKGMNSAVLAHLQGTLAWHEKDLAQAEAHYTEALALEENPDYFYRRALIRTEMGENAGILADLNACIALNPTMAEWIHFRAETYYDMNEPLLAIADYDQAEALGYTTPFTYYCRSIAHHDTDQFEKAIADSTTLLEHAPNMALAFQVRALSYIRLGQLDLARAECELATQHAPAEGLTQRTWGFYHLAQGQFDEAILFFEKELAAEEGEDAGIFFQLGLAHLFAQQFDQSLTYYQKGLAIATPTQAKEIETEWDYWSKQLPNQWQLVQNNPILATIREQLQTVMR